jgi:Flp pilus assembly protein TadD
MLALHEACALRHEDAALWTLYAASCVRSGRSDDALRAFGQALWLRRRAGDDRRARVTRHLRESLGSCAA